jgi:diguanylate cyclase (GGDEF)-like protein
MVLERTSQRAELSTAQDANRSLEKLSHEDGLTNLANRRQFDLYLTNQMALARRKRQTLALVMCDVDEFKSYNDRYGHQAGDECLRLVAAALKSCCRRPTDLAARYGGEEFALILPDTAFAGAIGIAEQARQAVARLKIPHLHSPAGDFVSFSGGVSIFVAQFNMTEAQLIQSADEALFQAKHEGRNRIVSRAWDDH